MSRCYSSVSPVTTDEEYNYLCRGISHFLFGNMSVFYSMPEYLALSVRLVTVST